MKLSLFIWYGVISCAIAVSPYNPTDEWSYYVEAVRGQAWPSCNFRFLSYTSEGTVDLWDAAGVYQVFTLIAHQVDDEPSGFWEIQTSFGSYLEYSNECTDVSIDAALNSARPWNLTYRANLSFSFEAVGRAGCSGRFLSFSANCDNHQVFLSESASAESLFMIHPESSPDPMIHIENTLQSCADPFAWQANKTDYYLMCTGGTLPLNRAENLSPASVFTSAGTTLGGTLPDWASESSRWAPENLRTNEMTNLAVFCDSQAEDGRHRVGSVVSTTGPVSESWDTYSASYLDLGGSSGGEIDPHLFVDEDGKTYLVWKTDDNSVGMSYTRIWAALVELPSSGANIKLSGSPIEILNSTGLWWVDSFVDGGSLVEGPEIIFRNGFYYLFFAAGKYCSDSYAEGVARATSVLGPYEKLGVPVLSTNLVGVGTSGAKLVGPGHASFAQDSDGDWLLVWHASEGENCERFAYVDRLSWTQDGWPVCDFTPLNSTHFA